MDRKLKNITLILVLSIGLIFLGTNVYATTGKVINDSTRLRKKASTSSEIVETIAKNETVDVIEEEGDWYKVKFKTSDGTVEGYIRNDLLEVEKSEEKTEEKKEDEKKEETSETTSEKQENNNTQTNINEIKESTVLELKQDTELQLLPLIFSCKTGKIAANTKVTVTEIIGNWCHIEANDKDGWVMKSKMASVTTTTENKKEETKTEETKTEEKKEEEKKEETSKTENTKMYVTTTTLNLRSKADTDSNVTTQLDYGDEVTVLEVVDTTWSKVKYGSHTGYVASKYLSKDKPKDVTSRGVQEPRKVEQEVLANEQKNNTTSTKTTTNNTTTSSKSKETSSSTKTTTKSTTSSESKTSTSTSNSKKTSSSSKVTGSDIVAYAKKYLGCKYVYGATGPNTFDCSGFTQYVYKHFGYSIPRTSTEQRNVSGAKVIKSKSDLKIGDIVCFPGHVGIYVGDGNFIHASHTGSDVKISSLSSSYYVNKFIQGTRILVD